MNDDDVQVSAATLTSSTQTASEKLVWMALLMDAHLPPQCLLSSARLAASTNLSRPTVRKALTQLADWYTSPASTGRITFIHPAGCRVAIPKKLIKSEEVGPQAKVMYGVLQTTHGYRNRKGHCKYASLSKTTGLDIKTVRRAVRELVQTGWLSIEQANKFAPIYFWLSDPIMTKTLAAQKRLAHAEFYGEALMKEYLSLIVDSEHYLNNADPGFLINSSTNALMELDRYYFVHSVAFEFNGAQHYGPTSFCSAKESAKQQDRDRKKAALCQTNGITLVVIHAEDLSLQTMRQKVGTLLPLNNDLRQWEPLINVLESASRTYRSRIMDARKANQSATVATVNK